jgi:hypothetical protein
MLSALTRASAILAVFSALPALAFSNPLDCGPLADFLNIFRQKSNRARSSGSHPLGTPDVAGSPSIPI